MEFYPELEIDTNESSNGDLRILVRGPESLLDVIKKAFPNLSYKTPFSARYGSFDWGVYIKNPEVEDRGHIKRFCDLTMHSVYIRDGFEETFGLAMHTIQNVRTKIGSLVYGAKPYNQSVSVYHIQNAQELASHYINFIEQHPSYKQSQIVVSVPASPDKQFDLPSFTAEIIVAATQQINGKGYISKLRTTRPMKEIRTEQEKTENIRGAFSADSGYFQGRSVIIIDDIYDSGRSINEVGKILRAVGASQIFGLVATKTQDRFS